MNLDYILIILITYNSLFIFLSLGILFEILNCEKLTTFFVVTASLIAIFLFKIPISLIAIYLIVYILIGTIWSFWRYKQYIKKIIIEMTHRSEYSKTLELDGANPKKMVSTIAHWIIVWPFSCIQHTTKDIVNMLKDYVSVTLSRVYNSIYETTTKEARLELTESKHNNDKT